MLKMFAFDLDNTLLTDQRIRGENLLMLKRLERSGIDICLISGRVLASVRYIAEEAGLRAYTVGSNGAAVSDPEGKIIRETYIRPDLAELLIDMGEKSGIYYHFYSANCLFSPYYLQGKYDQLMKNQSKGPERLQCDLFLAKSYELKKHRSEMMKFQFTLAKSPELGRSIVEEVKKLPDLAITMSGPGLLEIMASGVDKWTGLEYLAKHIGISTDEICVMGDHLNDKKMIEMAGIGVAMGNAIREVKEAADMVTDSFDQSGVAKAILDLKDRGAWIEV